MAAAPANTTVSMLSLIHNMQLAIPSSMTKKRPTQSSSNHTLPRTTFLPQISKKILTHSPPSSASTPPNYSKNAGAYIGKMRSNPDDPTKIK